MTRHTPPTRRATGRRRGIAALLAAAMLFGPTAEALARCTNETDQAIFEVEALKTELMVVATTCKGPAEDRYNDFVRRYQQGLVVSNRGIGQYFTRSHGKGGQRQQDIFITELANARSNAARQLGSDFCLRNAGLFTEVMSLPSPAELAPYAAAKDLLAAGVTACEGAPAPRHTAARRSAR
jgi:hypothetical protein